MNIFILPDGRLRAGWRLLLFLAFFIVSMIVANGVVRFAVGDPAAAPLMKVLAASSIAGFLAVLFSTFLMTALIEHQPFSTIGLQGRRAAGTEAALGLGGAVVLIAAIAAIERAAGLITFQSFDSQPGSIIPVLVATMAMILISAATEELLFRGYPFQRLIEGTNTGWSLVISSILFGMLHWSNPHSTVLAVINTVLAGILLSLCYLKTQRLWLAIGFHFGWNWALALMALPVSGLEMGAMPWRAVPASSKTWLYGGDYGPEGGIIATAALGLAIVWVLAKTWASVPDETSQSSLS